MTNEERIEQLKSLPPRPKKTWVQIVMEIVAWTCSVIAVVALTVGLYAANRASNVSNCVNHVLGTHVGPNANDEKAHIDFARALTGLFLPKNASKAERTTEVRRFENQVNIYVATLVRDQAVRNRTPGGEC